MSPRHLHPLHSQGGPEGQARPAVICDTNISEPLYGTSVASAILPKLFLQAPRAHMLVPHIPFLFPPQVKKCGRALALHSLQEGLHGGPSWSPPQEEGKEGCGMRCLGVSISPRERSRWQGPVVSGSRHAAHGDAEMLIRTFSRTPGENQTTAEAQQWP